MSDLSDLSEKRLISERERLIRLRDQATSEIYHIEMELFRRKQDAGHTAEDLIKSEEG